jgi:hypothetical protein
MSRLAVFDFDGTMFRSPGAPPWSERGWFIDEQSLSPPCVPERPGAKWWINSTVRAARKAIADQDTYAILCTGRVDQFFRWRIPEILRGAGLNFDEVHLSPGGGPQATGGFKRKVFRDILRRYPFIHHVELWDDNRTLLQSYIQMLKKDGYKVTAHPVKVPPMELDCTPWDMPGMSSPRQAVYTGLSLDSPGELLGWWQDNVGPVFPTTHANHMTMQFRPTPEQLDATPLGGRANIKVTGVAASDRIQVVRVDPGKLSVASGQPHVTIATQGTNPKGALRVLADGVRPVDGPVLSGTVGVSDSKRFYFSVGEPSANRVATRYLVGVL